MQESLGSCAAQRHSSTLLVNSPVAIFPVVPWVETFSVIISVFRSRGQRHELRSVENRYSIQPLMLQPAHSPQAEIKGNVSSRMTVGIMVVHTFAQKCWTPYWSYKTLPLSWTNWTINVPHSSHDVKINLIHGFHGRKKHFNMMYFELHLEYNWPWMFF